MASSGSNFQAYQALLEAFLLGKYRNVTCEIALIEETALASQLQSVGMVVSKEA